MNFVEFHPLSVSCTFSYLLELAALLKILLVYHSRQDTFFFTLKHAQLSKCASLQGFIPLSNTTCFSPLLKTLGFSPPLNASLPYLSYSISLVMDGGVVSALVSHFLFRSLLAVMPSAPGRSPRVLPLFLPLSVPLPSTSSVSDNNCLAKRNKGPLVAWPLSAGLCLCLSFVSLSAQTRLSSWFMLRVMLWPAWWTGEQNER